MALLSKLVDSNRRLARQLAISIETCLLDHELIEAADHLPAFKVAERTLAEVGVPPLDEDIRGIIDKIEQAVCAQAHYRCESCGCLYLTPPSGSTCTVCGAKVPTH